MLDGIKKVLEMVYDLVMGILKASGVNVDNFNADLFN